VLAVGRAPSCWTAAQCRIGSVRCAIQAGTIGQRGPLVAVTPQELGDFRFEGGLHQQLRAEPCDTFQDLDVTLCIAIGRGPHWVSGHHDQLFPD
jgi:hypothetical protein